MYIDLTPQSKLQPYVCFDWRLVAERGLRCYGHFHESQNESKTVASCELAFLLKASERFQPIHRCVLTVQNNATLFVIIPPAMSVLLN